VTPIVRALSACSPDNERLRAELAALGPMPNWGPGLGLTPRGEREKVLPDDGSDASVLRGAGSSSRTTAGAS
jgi:hypothetical protein